jgi:hypothetical protein
MDWHQEIEWRARTRELLEIELGGRVCDAMRPLGILNNNLLPSKVLRASYGPVHPDGGIDTDFHTVDLSEPVPGGLGDE